MNVWVKSWADLRAQALASLIESFGFGVHTKRLNDTDIVIWDLIGFHQMSFPLAPDLPTLALVLGDETEVHELLLRGFCGYIGLHDSGPTLKRALEAVLAGENWAERRVVARALAQAIGRNGVQANLARHTMLG